MKSASIWKSPKQCCKDNSYHFEIKVPVCLRPQQARQVESPINTFITSTANSKLDIDHRTSDKGFAEVFSSSTRHVTQSQNQVAHGGPAFHGPRLAKPDPLVVLHTLCELP